jgi:hypothetical protein
MWLASVTAKRIQCICVVSWLYNACAEAPRVPVGGAAVPVPQRDLLVRGGAPPAELGAYGYLLFLSMPNAPEVKKRYEAVCKSFVNNISRREIIQASDSIVYMVTFFPVTKQTPPDDCAALIENYDYTRAQLVAAEGNLLGMQGPLLVAWPKLQDQMTDGEAGLVFDASKVSLNNMDLFFIAWRQAIIEKPAVWHGWQMRIKKASFFLDKVIDDNSKYIMAFLKEIHWHKLLVSP